MKNLLKAYCAISSVAALTLAGTALAANSHSATGFNKYTVDTNGNISLGSQCSTANGCVVLINEPGLLQARVADSLGNQFFQTINTDNADSVGAGNVAIDVNGHPTDFRNESFVGVGTDNTGPAGTNDNTGSYSVSALNYVNIGSETDGASPVSYVDTLIRSGVLPSFVSNAGGALEIYQQNVVGSGTQQVTEDFRFRRLSLQGSANPFLAVGGAWMRIDQTGPINGTGDGSADYFTIREASGLFAPAGGSVNAPGGGLVSFNPGNYIKAVWMTSPVYNADGNAGSLGSNGTFEYGSVNNVTGHTGDSTANDSTTSSFDQSGITNVTWTPAGPGWWNTSTGLVTNVGATTDAFPIDPNLALGVVP